MTLLFVNTPAARAGTSLTIRARSFLEPFFIPHEIPAALKPGQVRLRAEPAPRYHSLFFAGIFQRDNAL